MKNPLRSNDCPFSPISLIDGGQRWGEGAALPLAETRGHTVKNSRRATDHSLSPISFIDGGEGWGEGAALPLAALRGNTSCFPLTQPSPPSTLGGEGSLPYRRDTLQRPR